MLLERRADEGERPVVREVRFGCVTSDRHYES
jgi:hypothetical protein